SPPERITEETLQQAHLSGVDRIAWQVDLSMEAGQLMVRRSVSESGNLHIPWPVEGRGRLTLSTPSLMERPAPYHLPLELARGTIGQLRNQLAEWRIVGLNVPEKVTQTLSQAMGYFGRAVGEEDLQESAKSAERAIGIALDTADLLVASYIDQALRFRCPDGKKLSVFFGGNLGSRLPDEPAAEQWLRSFNAAVVPLCWREIEPDQGDYRWTACDRQIQWCQARGLKVCCGPLLLLDPLGLPDWLYLYEDDFDNLASCVLEFVRAAVTRYRDKVDFWQSAGRLTSAETLSLSEEEKLRLAASAIEMVRSIAPDHPILISFDQPWGEYLSRREMDLPPLYFADALVRSGLDLSGVVLEINLGYHPGGTLPRPPLEFSRQLDYWSLLGLPLFVSLVVPSADGDDPLAQRRVQLPPNGWTASVQQSWVARYVPLILSKPFVQGVIWNQLYDSQPHEFPHGGLFDEQDQPKPALDSLAAIRQAHVE
ncbi:MAG: hypothetical protein ACYSWU_05535, partial [Planctomycetota bacterium]